jgi:hypothetical protein
MVEIPPRDAYGLAVLAQNPGLDNNVKVQIRGAMSVLAKRVATALATLQNSGIETPVPGISRPAVTAAKELLNGVSVQRAPRRAARRTGRAAGARKK